MTKLRGTVARRPYNLQSMLERFRAWRAERKRRRQELDREYAAEERALLDDADALGTELDQAEDAGVLLRGYRPSGQPDDKRD
jgi:hypothetical protein